MTKIYMLVITTGQMSLPNLHKQAPMGLNCLYASNQPLSMWMLNLYRIFFTGRSMGRIQHIALNIHLLILIQIATNSIRAKKEWLKLVHKWQAKRLI